MCGIIGKWGQVDRESFKNTNLLQGHRGPDAKGYYFDHKIPLALGHSRLSIQDLSALGNQPMLSEDESVVIVFNGEIYNFQELRNELRAEGYGFKSHSDTEVLLALYLRDGADMLAKLNGIFAYAIWDKRSQELTLARDALGVKPLYYAQSKNGFIFASEIKALLPLLDGVQSINPVAINRYLRFLWCPGEETPMEGVSKLGPGEAITVRDGQVNRRWRWYQLPAFRIKPIRMNATESVLGTTQALRLAVHRQVVADVPVGAFLSGGLDSSAIVALAREQVPDIKCFTIESKGGVEDGAIDDLPYAKRVAKHLGVSLEVVRIDSSRMAEDLESMIYQLDEPLADPAALNVLYISRLARQNGIKVLLSGSGGDDLFTGYRRHVAVNYERLWSWLPRWARQGLDNSFAGVDQRKPIQRRLTKLFSGAGLTGDARLVNYFIWTRESELMKLYTPEYRELLYGVSPQKPMLDFLAGLPESTSRLERLLALEQRFFLTDHNLNYTDKMSMAAGVEVRVPFLDLDLVEFAAKIPTKYKQRGTVGKWVLKKAMEPYLPAEVIYRTKTGFGAPLRRWMRYELREMMGDLLSQTSLRRRGIFDNEAVHQLIHKNDIGEVDASYTLLSLLCIEIWCRRFIDHPSIIRTAKQ